MIQTVSKQNSATAAQERQTKKLVESAVEFERMFASLVMKSMRKTVPENALFGRSTGEEIFTEMLDGEYSKMMVDNGSLGLAEKIVEQMGERDGSIDVTNALRTLKLGSHDAYRRVHENHFTPLKSYNSVPDATLINTTTKDLQAFQPEIRRWGDIISTAAQKYDLDPRLIAAVISAESAGDAGATSPAGAAGLMQLMPGTAQDLNVSDRYNPMQNVLGGSQYLRQMLDRFDGEIDLALAAYNAGPGTVERYEGVPPYRETQQYIQRVKTRSGILGQE